ncbi:MAG TPA: hypothetical protein PK336_04635 [Methanoculleus sp.]|nr:hypothetical protein [Methanoculleus sp.]
MSPRDEPPKGPQHSVYLKYLKALGNQELPYQISGRDEYAFLWRQWHRDRVAERNASKAWFDEPMPGPPARGTPPEPEPREEPPEPEEETVAPPEPKKRSQSRFKNLEL